MTIADFLKEIWTSSKERIKTPFTGAFTLSWLGLNYKLLVMIFSQETTTSKIAFIESYHTWNNSLWFPLISAFSFITIPKLIMLIQERLLKKVNKARVGFANKVSISKKRQERVLAYYDRQTEIEKSGSRDIEELTARVKEYALKMKDLSQKNSDLNQDLIALRESNDELESRSSRQNKITRLLYGFYTEERHAKYKLEIKEHSGSEIGEQIIQTIESFVKSDNPENVRLLEQFNNAFTSDHSTISPSEAEKYKGIFDFNLITRNPEGELTLSVFGKYLNSAIRMRNKGVDIKQAISDLLKDSE